MREKTVKGLTIAGMILLMALIFAAWIWIEMPKLDEGTVIQKQYTPREMQRVPVYDGKNITYRWQWHSERWEILVTGYTENGKKKTEWWRVSPEKYAEAEIGEIVQRGKTDGEAD